MFGTLTFFFFYNKLFWNTYSEIFCAKLLYLFQHDCMYETSINMTYKPKPGQKVIAKLQTTLAHELLFRESCFEIWVIIKLSDSIFN